MQPKNTLIAQKFRKPSSKKMENRTRYENSPKFYLFPQLSMELRQKIWKLSFRGRIVEVDVNLYAGGGHYASFWGRSQIIACQTITPNPATLFVDHESRTQTLKYYLDLLPGISDVPTYFCASIDTFALHDTFYSRADVNGEYNIHPLTHNFGSLIGLLTASELMSSVKTLIFSNFNLYNFREADHNDLVASRHKLFLPTSADLFRLKSLEEIIFVTDKNRPVEVPGFEKDGDAVNYMRSTLADTFKMRKNQDPSCQIPRFTVYKEPFRLPIFRDEMQEASDSRVDEYYELEEKTAEWFDSEY
ncbi:hypothetical protein SBOR_9437 [Sclerotinia borealis F-4128]|uniref:2EXR domain-containing protein n=1 Tax=Sclerotinia borealis (strain F-4128) TaxID=1432307 RepID=W9C5J7_SCLBF|nr:hypothetical protein SBOR_9437 [Sclerotinia borealis F-4128]